MSSTMDTAPKKVAARKRVRRSIPPQHGAWAMLAVPYLGGVIAAGFRWPDVPLLGAWLAGYLLSYFVLLAVKSRRPQRYRAQIGFYAALVGPLGALVLVAVPKVVMYAPWAALFAVNAWYSFRRNDRAVLNDLASVVQSCLMVFVVFTIADGPWTAGIPVFALCLAYFGGTVFYVKTMIRERHNLAFRWVSVGYHAIAFAAAAWLSPWAVLLFGWLLARALLLPILASNRAVTPKTVGFLEIAHSVALLAVVPTL